MVDIGIRQALGISHGDYQFALEARRHRSPAIIVGTVRPETAIGHLRLVHVCPEETDVQNGDRILGRAIDLDPFHHLDGRSGRSTRIRSELGRCRRLTGMSLALSCVQPLHKDLTLAEGTALAS